MTLFTHENTLACQELATWNHSGHRIVYRVRLEAEGSMVEHLGAMKLRGDGRWVWWRWRSRYHAEWKTGQGVVATEDEARDTILKGWS